MGAADREREGAGVGRGAAEDREGLSRRGLLKVSAAAIGALGAVAAPGEAAAVCRPAVTPGSAPLPATVSGYILARLLQHGCDTLFTIPAATCDRLLEAADGTRMRSVVTSSDLEAGYAADGYARLKGLGAVSVSYGPGILSMLNAIAGAYVERSPVVIINGGPSAADLSNQSELGILFSHSTGVPDLDRSLFRSITADVGRASTAAAVPMVVDRAIAAALRSKRPVYIEIATSLWREPLALPTGPRLDAPATPSAGALTSARQAATAVRERVRRAERPVLLLGEEIQRRGLSDAAAALVRQTGLPWATTLLGKGAIPESTPRFAGVHDGRRSPSRANAVLDRADVIIGLGPVLSLDHLTLVADGRIDRLTLAVDGTVRTGRGRRTAVDLPLLIAALGRLDWPARADWSSGLNGPARRPAPADTAPGMSHDDLFAEVRRFMTGASRRGTIVVADTNLSTHPAADLVLGANDRFVCGAAWKSIGHSLGVALGLSLASGAGPRPLVLCGDGGFQTIAQALSTLARQRRDAIVVVIDNGHYAIEQLIVNRPYFDEGCASPDYLDLNRWNYANLARAMGVPHAVQVSAVADLRQAFTTAATTTAGPSLISVRVRPRDLPAELRV